MLLNTIFNKKDVPVFFNQQVELFSIRIKHLLYIANIYNLFLYTQSNSKEPPIRITRDKRRCWVITLHLTIMYSCPKSLSVIPKCSADIYIIIIKITDSPTSRKILDILHSLYFSHINTSPFSFLRLLMNNYTFFIC